jgi:hypothetical protein
LDPHPQEAVVNTEDPVESMTVDQRRAIFKALVEHQDGGMTVAVSRSEAAREFSVTLDQVINIEREGLENQWPPL